MFKTFKRLLVLSSWWLVLCNKVSYVSVAKQLILQGHVANYLDCLFILNIHLFDGYSVFNSINLILFFLHAYIHPLPFCFCHLVWEFTKPLTSTSVLTIINLLPLSPSEFFLPLYLASLHQPTFFFGYLH